MTPPPPLPRLAVIGGGIAGLAAAWWLRRRFHVTLFERHGEPGFVAQSVALPEGPASAPRIDVPLRVFYPGYYPTLTRLYGELGVASEPVSYASSFFGGDGRLFFRYRNLRVGDRSYAFLLPQDLRGSTARRIVAGALRFGRAAARAPAGGAGQTIGHFAARSGCAPEFVQGLLLPAIATVCTCPYDAANEIPADAVVGYLLRGLTRQSVRRAVHGADEVAARLCAGIAELRCNAGVDAVHRGRGHDGVTLRLAGGETLDFQQVVFATQANQALKLLDDATPLEAAALGGFDYREVRVLMHRDEALLPARRADWSAVNLRVVPGQSGPESTIWINAVQPALRAAAPVFQTVQPQREPRAGRLISQAQFERPVVGAGSTRALAALDALHAEPARRIWFCGSYAQAGIPLLESAVRSAWAVAQRLAPEPEPRRIAAAVV